MRRRHCSAPPAREAVDGRRIMTGESDDAATVASPFGSVGAALDSAAAGSGRSASTESGFDFLPPLLSSDSTRSSSLSSSRACFVETAGAVVAAASSAGLTSSTIVVFSSVSSPVSSAAGLASSVTTTLVSDSSGTGSTVVVAASFAGAVSPCHDHASSERPKSVTRKSARAMRRSSTERPGECRAAAIAAPLPHVRLPRVCGEPSIDPA